MMNNLPGINRRVKEVVEHYANGNVSKFVMMLKGKGDDVSQQKFNRIFNIDTRTKKYPGVPSTITTAITNTFKELDANWLLTGEGEMFKIVTAPVNADDALNVERAKIVALQKEVAMLKSMVYEMAGKHRSYEECLDDIDNGTTVALTDLRRSGKKG